jgi:DNA-binding XRE family transcriptional regulator
MRTQSGIMAQDEEIFPALAFTLKQTRKKASMTQVDLAKKANTTQSSVARMESETYSRITLVHWLELMKLCGASINFNITVEVNSDKVN